MLLSFHKFPSSRGRTPAEPPASPWLPPKFVSSQIVARTIKNHKNRKNQRKIVQFSCYRIPLATRKKPDAQGLADAAGSGLVAICRKRGGVGGAKKTDFSRVWGRERSGSGLVAIRSQHNFSTLDERVLKLKVCSSKDVFLFTGRAYTHNCSEGNERNVNHAGCKSGSPE